MNAHARIRIKYALLALALSWALPVGAQSPAPATPPAATETRPVDSKAGTTPADDAGPLGPLAWFEGCWRGIVNQREFREHWMPLRGNLIVGTSHTVMQGRTLAFEYLRIEARDDGIYYVAAPSGQKETAFKFVDVKTDVSGSPSYTFANPAHEFPQRIVYRRGSEGWLYATVEGKVGGADRNVTYPMRRVDCETAEFIRK